MEKTYVTKRELTALCIAGFGENMIYTLMSSYVTDFYINVLQVPLIFILILMIFARIWDAVNDPIMGLIVDGHVSKLGKIKPYVLFTALPIAVLTFFMFFDPKLSQRDTMIYAAFIYVIWGMVFTMSDVPLWSLPNVMTPNAEERAKVISLSRVFNGIGCALPILLFTVLGFVLPNISDKTGVELDKQKYMILVIISAGLGAILLSNSFFHIKERVVLPIKRGKQEVLKRIIKCKPLMLVVIMGILASGRYMMQAAAIHVARYAFYIGPDMNSVDNATAAIQSSITIVNLVLVACAAIGMFASMIIIPILYKKYDYRKIIVFCCILGAISSAIITALGAISIYLDIGWVFYLCIPLFVIQSIPLGALNTTSYAMIGDCLDYMEWTTGYRDNALGSACQSFVNKLGNAVATAFIIITYIIVSLNPADVYSSGAVVAATDLSHVQRFAIFGLISVIPGISLLLCTIPVLFYDVVGNKKDLMMKELTERRKGLHLE